MTLDMWIIESGAPGQFHPLYWSVSESGQKRWTPVLEWASKFDSENSAREYALAEGLSNPRFRRASA